MDQLHGFLWVDIDGLRLSSEDKEILKHPAVSGIILFSRNYESPEQLRSLTQEIRAISPRMLITVDQEGGRVQRFRAGFTELPSMGHWGSAYSAAPEKTRAAFSYSLQEMVSELRRVGVYSTLVPVLDIDYQRSTVIGHRSFGGNAQIVTELSAFMIAQLHTYKMPVTGKHFPGHGFVFADSHHELPVDERSWDVIFNQDLQPFLQLSSTLDAIMLAHIVYTQMDALPVCLSHFWVQDVLRLQMRYDGLVMCDDLSMQAMNAFGSFGERATQVLTAGCDVLLLCNNRAGVIDVLDHVPVTKNEAAAQRIAHYSRFLL